MPSAPRRSFDPPFVHKLTIDISFQLIFQREVHKKHFQSVMSEAAVRKCLQDISKSALEIGQNYLKKYLKEIFFEIGQKYLKKYSKEFFF